MKKLLIVMFLSWLPLMLIGQSISESENPDAVFKQARDAAFGGHYGQAKTLLDGILAGQPNNHDASLLMARINLWQKDYAASREIFERVEAAYPQSGDVKELGYDLAFFSGRYDKVTEMAPALLEANPDRIDFKEKYAQSLWELGKREQAGVVADDILATDSNNEVALEIKRLLAEPEHPLKLHLNYSFDHFNKPYTRWWHLYSAGLSKKLDGYTLGGALNVGHLDGGDTEYQGEADSYITLSPQSYMYAMYGFSPGNYFPTHKASLEVWHQLPAEMYASLGLNYYHWNDHIFIATASLEKYLHQYWFCLRGYANFKDVGVATSWYFTVRRYFNPKDYLQVTLGVGTAPDEPYDIKTDLERQSAYSIRFLLMKELTARTTLRAGVGYASEEFSPNAYRNRIDGTVGIIYLLSK